MRDQRNDLDDAAEVAPAVDSHGSATKPRRKAAPLREEELLQRMFWNVGEVAFIARVGVRTVWRMAADPELRFPKPRRMRGRTLFARDEVLAYMAKEATR